MLLKMIPDYNTNSASVAYTRRIVQQSVDRIRMRGLNAAELAVEAMRDCPSSLRFSIGIGCPPLLSTSLALTQTNILQQQKGKRGARQRFKQ